jgi:recombinational DNA repair protein (RecF pathway)
LDVCAACHAPAADNGPAFSASAGGVVCGGCAPRQRDRRPLSPACHEALRQLSASGDAWRRPWGYAVRAELRQVLGGYVTYLLGRRPRLLPYLQGS